MGIMLVYDITNEKSFENIKNWIRNIEENASADVEKMLLGNKCEMEEKRQVSRERGEQLAIEYNIKFIETSAKESINVEEAFYTLARDIKAKMEKKLVRKIITCLVYIVQYREILFLCTSKLVCKIPGSETQNLKYINNKIPYLIAYYINTTVFSDNYCCDISFKESLSQCHFTLVFLLQKSCTVFM